MCDPALGGNIYMCCLQPSLSRSFSVPEVGRVVWEQVYDEVSGWWLADVFSMSSNVFCPALGVVR